MTARAETERALSLTGDAIRHDTPVFVTRGIELIEQTYLRHVWNTFDIDAHPVTANTGGDPIVTDTFEIRGYCWCEGTRTGHEDDCPPNFFHPASGLAVNWYKHAHRSSTASAAIDLNSWNDISQDCLEHIRSLTRGYRVLITGSREWGADLADGRGRHHEDWTSRPSSQRDAMVAALRGARQRAGDRHITVIHGAARGADRLAGTLAGLSANTADEQWPALWRPAGGRPEVYDRAAALQASWSRNNQHPVDRGAGHHRNEAMLDSGVDEVLAFFAAGAGNRGTAHCTREAEKRGLPVTKVHA